VRLRSVWISQYKNLRDFSIGFDGEGFIDIFVGRNGSGKSNFLEALIEIFDHLYDFGRRGADPDFDYRISYELDTTTTSIEWQKGVVSINGKERRTIGQTPLPANIIVYYSGQNPNVAGLVKRYEDRFRKRIRGADMADSPAFIGIGPDYKKLLILLLLLLPDERQARQFLCAKLGILGTGTTVRLQISQPLFASRKQYDHLEPGDLFWGLAGVTRVFLDDLVSCIQGGATPGTLHNRDTNQYEIPINVALFRRVFGERPWDEMFQLFNNLRIMDMLNDISMDVTLEGLELSDLSYFSDGQFQSVYLFAIAELFKDRNCITLLDEPDAFLHPEWQFEFLKQTGEISEAAARTNHILMSSHSAATLIPSLERKVKYFEIKNGRVICNAIPKKVAIERLSARLIRYTEEEQLLSIVNAIQIEHKPVLFTEGSIDPIIIREAWHKLYDAEPPFIPFYAFSCSYLKQLIQDPRITREMGGRPVFGLFDIDKAYDHWNGIAGERIQEDIASGACIKVRDQSAYALLLPVPANGQIRAQVFKNGTSGESFGGDSLCEIEHLFYGDARTAEFFDSEPTPGGGLKITIRTDAQKERFAKETIPLLPKEYFEVFRPMFELMQRIIGPTIEPAATASVPGSPA